MTRVIVCGGRNYSKRDRLFGMLDFFHVHVGVSVLIHGAARGADTLAAQWAESKGVQVEAYPADWTTHGRAAGPLRNGQMLRDGAPDWVIAFPGGTGTADMVRRARAAGVGVMEVGR